MRWRAGALCTLAPSILTPLHLPWPQPRHCHRPVEADALALAPNAIWWCFQHHRPSTHLNSPHCPSRAHNTPLGHRHNRRHSRCVTRFFLVVSDEVPSAAPPRRHMLQSSLFQHGQLRELPLGLQLPQDIFSRQARACAPSDALAGTTWSCAWLRRCVGPVPRPRRRPLNADADALAPNVRQWCFRHHCPRPVYPLYLLAVFFTSRCGFGFRAEH